MKYNVYQTDISPCGERVKIDNEALNEEQLYLLMGSLLGVYGSAKEVDTGYIRYRGRYQSADGEYLEHGAALFFDRIMEGESL